MKTIKKRNVSKQQKRLTLVSERQLPMKTRFENFLILKRDFLTTWFGILLAFFKRNHFIINH